MPELPLFADEAARALRVFKRLRLPDVAGTPALGDAGAAWFFDVVAALFGSYDAAAQQRRIQEVFLLVPKKNAKTSYSAALIVTGAIVNRRPLAEFQLLAPTKEIADIAFARAAGMIRLDPALAKLFHVQQHTRTITHRRTGAVVKVKAADTDAITGTLASTLVDEVHVFAAHPRAREVYIELRGAFAARADGFLFQITTQSKSPPAGIFRSELETARAVRDGELVMPSMLPVLYELPERDKWRDKALWPLLNPNFGRSVRGEFLDRELDKAEREGPEQLALFASQHLNVEIGLALRSDRWAGADYWEGQATGGLTLESLLARSEVVTIGIDGGGLDDLLALAVLGREPVTRKWLLWVRAWAFVSVLARRKSEAARLEDFAAAGELVIVERLGDNVEQVADLCAAVEASGKLDRIGLDPVGIGAIVDALAQRGIAGDDKIIGITQGWKLTAAIKTAERQLASGMLEHAGQAVMAWAVGNARVEPKGNAIVITKQASGTAKIDPLMAALDAVALMATNPEAAMGKSVYEEIAAKEAQKGSKAPERTPEERQKAAERERFFRIPDEARHWG